MSALLLSVVACTPTLLQSEARPEEVAWLAEHAVPLAGVEAGAGFEDLEPLRAIVGDARVVALGESTHGSREQFQMKHRLVEFLASEMGFDAFAIEASMPEAHAVDGFVSGGEGDPVELIRGMYFWTWQTEEVLAMVEWMRAFNEEHADDPEESIRFTGFDMQNPDVAARIVGDSFAQIDEARAADVRDRYAEIVRRRDDGQNWTSATGSLPHTLVAGKKVVFAGKIRSEDVQYAALWFRADREGKSAAFMNTQQQHRDGDEWVEHEIELDIPADVDGVVFGLIHSGGGTAWCDDLSITVDGEPLAPEGFDLGMEEDGRGFQVMSSSYRGRMDTETAAVGEASFRIDRVAPLSEPDTPIPARALETANEILAELEASESELAAELGDEAAAWTVQMARVVAQCMASRTIQNPTLVRDRAMAENIQWILDRDPDSKLILWAHNGHVGNHTTSMGAHLEEALGDDYVPVGFLTSRGEYRAVPRSGPRGLRNHPLLEAPPASIESFFEAADLDVALLDLRQAEKDSPGSGWLHQVRLVRSIGALEMDVQFFPIPTFPAYEVLVYTADTTGAWPMREAWSVPPAKDE